MYNHMKKGVTFVEKIIDDHINNNIELYYAFSHLFSFTTLKKVTIIETRKNELKKQMKIFSTKNHTTYKKVNRFYLCSPFIFLFYL